MEWPGGQFLGCPTILSPHLNTPLADYEIVVNNTAAAGTWPAANRAIYAPVYVNDCMILRGFSVQVTTTGGNMDIGIYSEGTRARLASTGTVAVGAVGFQGVTLGTPVELDPGCYLIGMVASLATAAFQRTTPASAIMRVHGVMQEALGSTVLPATATLAAPASNVVPGVLGHCVSVI